MKELNKNRISLTQSECITRHLQGVVCDALATRAPFADIREDIGFLRGDFYGFGNVVPLSKSRLNIDGGLHHVLTPSFKYLVYLLNNRVKVKPEFIYTPADLSEFAETITAYPRLNIVSTVGEAVLETDAALKQRGIIK